MPIKQKRTKNVIELIFDINFPIHKNFDWTLSKNKERI